MRGMSLSHIPLPSIVLSNVQALTETWLSHKDLDKEVTIDGFGKPIRLDRDTVATGKSTGGDYAFFLMSVTVMQNLSSLGSGSAQLTWNCFRFLCALVTCPGNFLKYSSRWFTIIRRRMKETHVNLFIK